MAQKSDKTAQKGEESARTHLDIGYYKENFSKSQDKKPFVNRQKHAIIAFFACIFMPKAPRSAYFATLLSRLILAAIAFVFVLLLAIPIGFYGMALYIAPTLPDIKSLETVALEMPLRIYTKDGKMLGQFGNRYSEPVQFNEVPAQLVQAFLSAEDASFYEHSGISVKGIARALSQAASDSDNQTGGSTITMQVAKNYFLNDERTINRKLTELFLARKIEGALDKNAILILYFNKIYMGEGAYGIKAAARRYYNKSLDELTLGQMAMLAGLPKAPGANNPVLNPKRAMARRNWILGQMRRYGYIDDHAYQNAIVEDISLNQSPDVLDVNMPYLAEMARQSLALKYGDKVADSGWRVEITVASDLQAAADKAVHDGILAYDHRHGFRGVEAKEGDLAKFVRYGDMYPAQVVKTDRGGFDAKLQDGRVVRVASAIIGSVGAVRVGNIVRIVPTGDGDNIKWRMTQAPAVQSALASIDPNNGAILAMVGGFDFAQSKFNRAAQGYRQPGSIIKPLVYSAAFENGKTPQSSVSDAPLRVGKWQPKNADGRFYGDMPMNQALYLSRNLPAVRTLKDVGINTARTLMGHMGLERERLPEALALALGAADATPLQMATAYATFANGGHRVQPYLIERIYDYHGNILYQANPAQACASCFNKKLAEDGKKDKEPTPRIWGDFHPANPVVSEAPQAPRIISPSTAEQMAGVLREVITKGTGRRAQALNRPDVGGKTGTTNLAKDAWFAGIHPSTVAVVWVGFDNPKPLGAHEFGGVAALPIWVDYMKIALKDKPVGYVVSGNPAKSKKVKQEFIDLVDESSKKRK